MRHIDRLRTGVALAGILLCLTSTTAVFSQDETASEGTPQTLREVCHANLDADRSVEWFAHLRDRYPLWIVRNSDGPHFRQLAAAFRDAPVTAGTNPGHPVGTFVFFHRTGNVDKVIYLTDSGLLYEPVSRRYFRPGAVILDMIVNNRSSLK